MSSAKTAEYFTNVNSVRMEMLNFLPPYELQLRTSGWYRGIIRHGVYGSGETQDFVITGPKMRILFDGCKWNRICFAMTPETSVKEFSDWIDDLETTMESVILQNPLRFKVNPAQGPVKIDKLSRVSHDPAYSNSMRCWLSVSYESAPNQMDVDAQQAVVNASLFLRESGEAIEPYEIKGGWSMIPIFKISYQKQGNTFGLILTVLKGEVSKKDTYVVSNAEWEIDYPMTDN